MKAPGADLPQVEIQRHNVILYERKNKQKAKRASAPLSRQHITQNETAVTAQ
jgi:hypothetical protein